MAQCDCALAAVATRQPLCVCRGCQRTWAGCSAAKSPFFGVSPTPLPLSTLISTLPPAPSTPTAALRFSEKLLFHAKHKGGCLREALAAVYARDGLDGGAHGGGATQMPLCAKCAPPHSDPRPLFHNHCLSLARRHALRVFSLVARAAPLELQWTCYVPHSHSLSSHSTE
eukprot:2144807-Pleurochrysis_carterae.AAC.2